MCFLILSRSHCFFAQNFDWKSANKCHPALNVKREHPWANVVGGSINLPAKDLGQCRTIAVLLFDTFKLKTQYLPIFPYIIITYFGSSRSFLWRFPRLLWLWCLNPNKHPNSEHRCVVHDLQNN